MGHGEVACHPGVWEQGAGVCGLWRRDSHRPPLPPAPSLGPGTRRLAGRLSPPLLAGGPRLGGGAAWAGGGWRRRAWNAHTAAPTGSLSRTSAEGRGGFDGAPGRGPTLPEPAPAPPPPPPPAPAAPALPWLPARPERARWLPGGCSWNGVDKAGLSRGCGRTGRSLPESHTDPHRDGAGRSGLTEVGTPWWAPGSPRRGGAGTWPLGLCERQAGRPSGPSPRRGGKELEGHRGWHSTPMGGHWRAGCRRVQSKPLSPRPLAWAEGAPELRSLRPEP